MLKIRDDVDLQELINFGFKEDINVNYTPKRKLKRLNIGYRKYITGSEIYIVALDEMKIHNPSTIRTLIISGDYIDCRLDSEIADTIFDLIQAGLIEKI